MEHFQTIQSGRNRLHCGKLKPCEILFRKFLGCELIPTNQNGGIWKMKAKSNKLQAKGLINVGIFTAIYFVIFFAGMMLGYIPIFIPLLGLVCPILCGIPFMLYLTKVKKFGMVSLTGIILGLLNLIMGSGVLVLVAGIIFGIASDLILRAGKYQSWKYAPAGGGIRPKPLREGRWRTMSEACAISPRVTMIPATRERFTSMPIHKRPQTPRCRLRPCITPATRNSATAMRRR